MVGSVGVGPTYTQGFNLELSPDQLTLHKEGQRKCLVSFCPFVRGFVRSACFLTELLCWHPRQELNLYYLINSQLSYL